MVNTNITLQVAVVKISILSSKEGVCYASIYIKDDFFKGAIKNGSSNKCLKKIKAFNYKY